MTEALWNAAPLGLRAFQKAQLFELLERRSHRAFGRVKVDFEGIDQLVSNLPSRILTVTSMPDEAGGLVELVNEIRGAIEYHHLALDETGINVGSSPGMFHHHAVRKLRPRS